jgi:hypothetical protein
VAGLAIGRTISARLADGTAELATLRAEPSR